MPTPDRPPCPDASAAAETPSRVTPDQLAAAARARDYWAGRRSAAEPSHPAQARTQPPGRP